MLAGAGKDSGELPAKQGKIQGTRTLMALQCWFHNGAVYWEPGATGCMPPFQHTDKLSTGMPQTLRVDCWASCLA